MATWTRCAVLRVLYTGRSWVSPTWRHTTSSRRKDGSARDGEATDNRRMSAGRAGRLPVSGGERLDPLHRSSHKPALPCRLLLGQPRRSEAPGADGAQVTRIEAVACDSAHEAAWLDWNLLEVRRPRWNRAIGGQEVPVLIKLDRGPRSPGLTIVHEAHPGLREGARHFGPYLGGNKVRLAVSGLRRMLPVAYASEMLTGSDRDMARVLGVDARDREALLLSLGAVLGRDPGAVASIRAALKRRRDEAASAHDFERAARLQAEMVAIEWVVADQKMAVLDPLDITVCGWAHDVLVSFEMRRGRVCSWQQRRCSEAGARRHVESTPLSYADFGRRNAELAARLMAR